MEVGEEGDYTNQTSPTLFNPLTTMTSLENDQ